MWRRTRLPARRNSRKSTRPSRCWAIPKNAGSTTNSGLTGATKKAAFPSRPADRVAAPARNSTSVARGSAISLSSISVAAPATGFRRKMAPAPVMPARGGAAMWKEIFWSLWTKSCTARCGLFPCRPSTARAVKFPRRPSKCGFRRVPRMAAASAFPAMANPVTGTPRPAICFCASATPPTRTSAASGRTSIMTSTSRRGRPCLARISRCQRSMAPSSCGSRPGPKTASNSGCGAAACPRAKPVNAAISSSCCTSSFPPPQQRRTGAVGTTPR